jgi:hypothetical protein
MDMKRLIRTVLFFSLASLMSAPALAGPEDEPTAGAMTADVLIARPLGIAITAVGAALFVVSLPFSALGGNVEQSADGLVIKPAAETFARCLGCRSSGRYRGPAN